MNPAAEPVLIAGVCLLGLSLLALFGRAHPTRRLAAWVAMIGFAGLASYASWLGVQWTRCATPAYYDLPGSPPGPHRVTLLRRGVSPGYRGRLVRRSDRRFDPDRFRELRSCHWRIDKCEKLVLTRHTFDDAGVLEFESDYDELVLQYDGSPEMAPLLGETVLELTCPQDFRKFIPQGRVTSRASMGIYLGALLLAAVGAGVQRRRLQRKDRSDPRSGS